MTRPVQVGGTRVGGGEFTVVAGPCAIESREQLLAVARHVRAEGASALRGGVFKMRTDPRSFQGLGTGALEFVDEVRRETGLPFIAEVAAIEQVEVLAAHVDALQVGSRNMHNYYLLKELGRARLPILLKRGFAAQLREWLLAAEYVVEGGNESVILCERGIRTFESETRNTLDLAGAVWARQHSHFPVLVDPSHATGRPELIGPMCLAAAAAGLDGVMVEVQPKEKPALSDGFQALSLERFTTLARDLRPILVALGRDRAEAAVSR
ncbi:MAG: 3-deoxy-7-phosphoheptulonate synthase [Acidobacteria bacterium]|nr:3-deoxy-7-phosphoheptulonate synthase [Acidobacteriota bacterium]